MCCCEEGSQGKFSTEPAKNQGNVNQHISLVETLVGVVSFSLKTQVYKGIAQNIHHLERTHQSPQRREDKAGNKKLNIYNKFIKGFIVKYKGILFTR